ncbi:MAG: hypothetical protein ACRCX2_37775 [Paraclostridium sp.]
MTKLKLKKTKVPMKASEHDIYNLINQFEVRCSSVYCEECNVVSNNLNMESEESIDTTECMSRYIYERIIDID